MAWLEVREFVPPSFLGEDCQFLACLEVSQLDRGPGDAVLVFIQNNATHASGNLFLFRGQAASEEDEQMNRRQRREP